MTFYGVFIGTCFHEIGTVTYMSFTAFIPISRIRIIGRLKRIGGNLGREAKAIKAGWGHNLSSDDGHGEDGSGE